MNRFKRGDPIVMRSVVPAEEQGSPQHVGFTYPAIIIEDSSEAIVTWQPAGTFVMERTGTRQADGRLMLPGGWDGGYAAREWSGDGVVRVYRPGDEWSTWRWLGNDGAWIPLFYINLEEPWRRSRFGFDSNDWILDLLVERSPTTIRFKDEDELAWSLANGLITPLREAQIRDAGKRARLVAASDGWPFDADWNKWHPDSTWPIPSLAGGWHRVG